MNKTEDTKTHGLSEWYALRSRMAWFRVLYRDAVDKLTREKRKAKTHGSEFLFEKDLSRAREKLTKTKKALDRANRAIHALEEEKRGAGA